MKLRTLLFSFIAFLLVPVLPMLSQPFEDGPASEKIEQLRRIKLIEALDLTEEQSIRLFARENEFRKEQKEFGKKKNEANETLYELIKDGAGDEKLLAGIEHVRSIDEEFHKNRYQFIMSLNDILSVEQIAKMVVFEQKFAREIREIIQSLREQRPPGPKRRR